MGAPGLGFASDDNAVVVVDRRPGRAAGPAPKTALAGQIWAALTPCLARGLDRKEVLMANPSREEHLRVHATVAAQRLHHAGETLALAPEHGRAPPGQRPALAWL